MGFAEFVKQAYINGAVLAGVSAGAICWFNRGVTDSWANSLKIMDCLGLSMVTAAHITMRKKNEGLRFISF
ncbi:MAG: hypothetical protein CM15mP58_16340 [Burkholderiaceae bacterium]|nr:MAG: hypothetical protein CM15mP58_16340 [Burkholderiaceae bacterium]